MAAPSKINLIISANLRDRANQNVWDVAGAGAPTNGTSGTLAGQAGPGSTYVDITNKILYLNTNTLASPTWTAISGASGTVTLNGVQTLTNKTLTSPVINGGTGTSLAMTGAITSSGGGIGYATGAGGIVTQTTSKSTGVTCSHLSGAVTMSNAALAPQAIVSFVLTDSFIAATDVLILNHISGGTPGSYHLNAQALTTGAATINVTNISAGTLSEAIVIQFAVVKAVSA